MVYYGGNEKNFFPMPEAELCEIEEKYIIYLRYFLNSADA